MTKLGRIASDKGRPARRIGIAMGKSRSPSHYYAFLSYSHADEELARWLHRQLEQFRVPAALAGKVTANGVVPRKLTPVFRDQQELAAATDLGDEIRGALANSQFLIVLCTPAAAKSHWVDAEIAAFKKVRPDGCVLAVVADGEPFASEIAGRADEECFPPSLREKFDSRGRHTGRRAEPLAADIRGDPDHRRTGFLKLVAGMLGVGLDDLVQRDTVRRQKRMAWVAMASIAGMAMTSVLAIVAIQSRDFARDQRREAEGLVAYMLGDLKDKLEPIGKLDALDGVGARVLAYYAKQDKVELTDAALLQRARALSLTAQVAYLRGNFESASRSYAEAMAATGEAVRRDPGDPQRLYDHAQNVFWVGDLARQQGRIAQADASYREYKRLADRMVEAEPANLKWLMEVQYASSNLGILAMRRRDFAEAANLFRSTIGPLQSFITIDPDNSEYQRTLANVLGWYADAERARGNLDLAIAARERQVAFLNSVIRDDRADVFLRERLVPAHQGLGILFDWLGQREKAVGQLRLALAEADRLRNIEPDNSTWSDQAANARLALARILHASGHIEEASRETVTGCKTAEELDARNASVARWRVLSTLCLSMRARLAQSSGNLQRAGDLAQRALASARSQRSGDPVADRFTVASAYLLLGKMRRDAGDEESARAAWRQGAALLPRSAPISPSEMDISAQLLRLSGRPAEAAPVAARLAATGYVSAA